MILLNNILKNLNVIQVIGDSNIEIHDVIPLDENNKQRGTISWCSDKNINILDKINYGVIICSDKRVHEVKDSCTYIMVENPRFEFAKVLKMFKESSDNQSILYSDWRLDPSIKLGKDVRVGHNVVIENNCIIGDKSVIGHNTVIHYGTIIGEGAVIGSNCTIGGIGFGYEKNEKEEYTALTHIGNVKIGNGVEIGNNTCIDRAVLGSTIIKDNVKIDNLVHIAHGVVIGRNSLIIANSMIAGSVEIGANCWISPSVSIKNKLFVGENTLIGMGAVVLKNVDSNQVIIGNPGKVLNK